MRILDDIVVIVLRGREERKGLMVSISELVKE
jgi:hypothetical protein